MTETQLERLERKVDLMLTALGNLTSLVRTTLSQELLMANQTQDLAAQLDAATNLLAGKLDSANSALATEQTAIVDLQGRVQGLIDAETDQATIDQLTAIRDRLGASASSIDGVAQTISGHVATLQAIGTTSPSNPVPGISTK